MDFPISLTSSYPRRTASPAVRFALVLLAIALTGLAGLGGPRIVTLGVMAIAGMAVFAIGAFWPPAAVAILLFSAGFVRFKLSTGTESALVASLLVAIAISCSWFLSMWLRRDVHVVRSPVTAPLIAFAAVNVVSLITGRATIDPRITVPSSFIRVQIAALILVLVSIATVLMIGGTVRRYRWFAVYLTILFAVGTLHQTLLFVHGPDQLVEGRGLVPMWCVCLAAGQAIYNTRLAAIWRLACAGVSGICLYVLLIHKDWISGWLPALVSLFVVLVLRSRLSALLTVLITIVLLLVLWGTIYEIFTVDKVKQGSIGNDSTGRTALWQRTLSTIRASPVFGTGPAAYAVAEIEFYPNDALSSHSNFIDVMAETGIIGTLSFFWFLAAALLVGWRAQRRLRARGDPVGGSLAIGALGGLVAMIVAMWFGDWVIPFVYNQTIAGFDYTIQSWIGIGMLVALDAMSRSNGQEIS